MKNNLKRLNRRKIFRLFENGRTYYLGENSTHLYTATGLYTENYFSSYSFIIVVPREINLNKSFISLEEPTLCVKIDSNLKQKRTYRFIAMNSRLFTARVEGFIQNPKNSFLVLKLKSGICVFCKIREEGKFNSLKLTKDQTGFDQIQ